MFIYENEGFLEVETNQINQLCRSTHSVDFGDTSRGKYELHAVLCDSLDKSEPRCRIAFYDKTLKRALVFAVSAQGELTAWQNGQEKLVALGFECTNVNLQLSPAMQEVVLRDVAGLETPDEARRQRTKKLKALADFQQAYDTDPKSSQGKKAALKLNAEKRLTERADNLRQILEDHLSPEENESFDNEAILSQLKDLTARLEVAEQLAEAERSQREMSESITAAAEKRIQELEEILVDVETKSSDEIKLKRKVVQLQTKIKGLDAELVASRTEIESERDKQVHFIEDVKRANEQIAGLEKNLKKVEVFNEELQLQLTQEGDEKVSLDKNFKEAELRVKVLNKELEMLEEQSSEYDEAIKELAVVKDKLDQLQSELQDSLELNSQLEKQLASVKDMNDDLVENLKNSEEIVKNKDEDQDALTALTIQYENLIKEHADLLDEYDQVRSVRKRLERVGLEDDRRIEALEEQLASEKAVVEALSSERDSGSDVANEMLALKGELQGYVKQLEKEQSFRVALEKDLDGANRMIDSLEQMVRETSTSDREIVRGEESESVNGKVQELEGQLHLLEEQFEQERIAQKSLVDELAATQKELAAQEASFARKLIEKEDVASRPSSAADASEVSGRPATKPLPHELRPAPKKGVLFCPDWDLEGLPCNSSEQVLKVWETVFNVQISLEGYPAQYCMAFLVLLRVGKQKKLFMLFRLKQSKHTLVSVPAKTPKDEKSLKKAIKEGLKYLKMSGFEMEELSGEHIEGSLGSYFLDVD